MLRDTLKGWVTGDPHINSSDTRYIILASRLRLSIIIPFSPHTFVCTVNSDNLLYRTSWCVISGVYDVILSLTKQVKMC